MDIPRSNRFDLFALECILDYLTGHYRNSVPGSRTVSRKIAAQTDSGLGKAQHFVLGLLDYCIDFQDARTIWCTAGV
jgi:hypothetical protein